MAILSITSLTPKQSRAAALALLLVAIAAAAAALLGPVFALHRHYDFYLDKYSDELARYQRVAALRAELEFRLAAVKAHDPRRNYLKTSTPALAASEIQDIAKGIIESNGAKLLAVQIQQHKDDGRFRQVTINVQMTATIPAIRKILYTLETTQPNFFVDNLLVRTTVGINYRPAPGPEPEMWLQFDLTGYAVTS